MKPIPLSPTLSCSTGQYNLIFVPSSSLEQKEWISLRKIVLLSQLESQRNLIVWLAQDKGWEKDHSRCISHTHIHTLRQTLSAVSLPLEIDRQFFVGWGKGGYFFGFQTRKKYHSIYSFLTRHPAKVDHTLIQSWFAEA